MDLQAWLVTRSAISDGEIVWPSRPLCHSGDLLSTSFADGVHQLARGFDLGRHVGDLETNRLEVRRLARQNCDALLGVGDGVLQRHRGRRRSRARRSARAPTSRPADDACKIPLLPRPRARGRASRRRARGPDRRQLPGFPAEVPDLADRLAASPVRKFAALLFKQKRR